MSDKRSFTVVHSSIKQTGGRYRGDTPFRAAKHAAKILFKSTRSNEVTFCIRETTRGSDHKEYSYTAERKARAKPLDLTIQGQNITSDHIIIVHAT